MNAAERVAHGAALLDRSDPHWWRKIDLGTLNISCGSNCVLGQLHGDYATGCAVLRSGIGDAVALGFYVDQRIAEDGQQLNAEWRAEVTRRRQAAGMLEDIKRETAASTRELVPA